MGHWLFSLLLAGTCFGSGYPQEGTRLLGLGESSDLAREVDQVPHLIHAIEPTPSGPSSRHRCSDSEDLTEPSLSAAPQYNSHQNEPRDEDELRATASDPPDNGRWSGLRWLQASIALFTHDRSNSVGKSARCIICLEELDQRACRRLYCSHIFHRDCIGKWRVASVTHACPICRAVIAPGILLYSQQCPTLGIIVLASIIFGYLFYQILV
ncbi:hypothetical protein PGTUg99_010945 [Puccinia graminis f. sp. tritici]|uniref:RING-type domain-containing protein n=1 Tax=Puccinia graminis f. sp. tritici TaxID=56615 RepID=A0A5B0RWR3_PUCGR|nr:hypothetical protein PGTUg99_010945 [Puccinia graminis f. sp. tritici]